MKLTTAVRDMETAYTDAAGRTNTNPERINLAEGLISGEVLTPGIYTFDGELAINDVITFSGSDIFIVQIAGDLTLDKSTRVELSNGALAKNIFWQVAGRVKVGEGSHMAGIILVKTDALFMTGSSLQGHVLTQTRCDLQSTTIVPAPSA
jgi:hypothetical protein